MKQIRYLHVTYTLAQVTQILLPSMTLAKILDNQSIIEWLIDCLKFSPVIEDSKISVTWARV